MRGEIAVRSVAETAQTYVVRGLRETGLSLPQGLSFEEWEAVGQALARVEKGCMWGIGDWWHYGDHSYGDRAAQALDSDTFTFQTYANAGWVAGKIETSRRREVLSFSHHDAVAALEPAGQDEWLDRAEAESWSVHELRRRLRSDDDGDEWYTPPWLFDSLGIEFSIDVCAPVDDTHTTVPAKRSFTIKDDGLAQTWKGTIWCNPPYSSPAPWAERCVEHGDGLLLTHVPMNAEWCSRVWDACGGIRLFQGMEFVRPDGSSQRPGYWLQLASFGARATAALADLEAPPEVAVNERRVPSPMWRAA